LAQAEWRLKNEEVRRLKAEGAAGRRSVAKQKELEMDKIKLKRAQERRMAVSALVCVLEGA
jgi:hypothetical protein